MDLIRLGRVTRLLPRVPINPLHSFYRKFLNGQSIARINDFDGNIKLDVNLKDAMGVSLWHAPHRVEIEERRLFCEAIKPGCVVLDVGANMGIYTLIAAKRGATVFSIEPHAENAKSLKHHIAINNLSASVFEIAASDRKHLVSLCANPVNCGGIGVVEGNDITADTIDSLSLPPIDVCKMDIEGHEAKALIGMRETLKRSPQMKLLIECNGCGDEQELLRILKANFSSIRRINKENLWCEN